MPEKELTRLVTELGPATLMGFLAGLVNNTHKVLNGQKFRFVLWLGNGITSAWVGMSVALIIVEPGKFQLIVASICGICANQIFDLVEKNGAGIILKAFLRAFNLHNVESGNSSK